MPQHQMHQIGHVASRVGLSLRTVRYYGEVGLAEPSGRTEGGFRLYTDEDIARLELIKQLKPLEFTLEELRDLLAVRDDLGRDDLEQASRRALSDRLAGYVDVARQRCELLREQLTAAEAVTDRLEREVRGHRRRRSRSRR
ncbi:MAG TPA: MerR family transcriptional regulator [Egibacteraceae bacterium]|nr:MerR family transcriptional regulator [Actinomycetota bacterium]HWB72605.1 MerR family transcriptional regulator [Egibacteraceae bacterium]